MNERGFTQRHTRDRFEEVRRLSSEELGGRACWIGESGNLTVSRLGSWEDTRTQICIVSAGASEIRRHREIRHGRPIPFQGHTAPLLRPLAKVPKTTADRRCSFFFFFFSISIASFFFLFFARFSSDAR